MTEEFKSYILENIPTKVLLRIWKARRPVKTKQMLGLESWENFPNKINYGDDTSDFMIRIIVPKFASWNPNK